jgi:hypothetical protein
MDKKMVLASHPKYKKYFPKMYRMGILVGWSTKEKQKNLLFGLEILII